MDETIPLDSIQAIAATFGASFCAEKIIDTVLEKDGTRYYKVRWVKYSWEPTSSFIHLEHLIRDFWTEFEHHIPEVQEKVHTSNEILNVQSKVVNEQELIPQFDGEKHKDELNTLLSTFDAPQEDISHINNVDSTVSHSFTQLASLNKVQSSLEISDHIIHQIVSQGKAE
ncbi:uncharacterized protein LOC136092811 [Hydra vulgaris]|uniref:uncharacterized protein LOC136092811 n=1 Tax=Hydra vulgaris TaxID=6087 RepID=UPI0032E9DB23